MQEMVIKGGNRLSGEVEVAGSKNAALPVLFASLLATGESVITRVPELADIRTTFKLLNLFGAKTSHTNGTARIDTSRITELRAPYDLVRTMRASILVLGPLVARHGEAEVSLPGGCAIGARPIDLHLKAMETLGAKITLDHGYVKARAKRLVGARVSFDKVTVGGTENTLMAASLAKGETVIENAAREPEIVDLANALISMGAQIEGHGTPVIRIQGVDELNPAKHRVVADRIEAGTLLAAVAATGGKVTLRGIEPALIDAVLVKFREMGCRVDERPGERGDDSVAAVSLAAPARPNPIIIQTAPYPGFPTDMQAQMMAVLARGKGASVVTENIFENRFMHVLELLRMGAHIRVEGNVAVIEGVKKLSAAPVMATDLRASASLIIAALAAEGTTVVSRIYHLDRGYERIEEKLKRLGADITRKAADA